MTTSIKILRSTTAGVRPTGKLYGEPYVNFADNQFGVFDSGPTPRDLIGAPIFSTAASYVTGNPVNYQGKLYIANTSISAGAFNPAQWTQVLGGGGSGGGVTVSDTPPGSPIAGDLWWESDTGTLWVYYTDVNSSQWVAVNSGGAAPSGALINLQNLTASASASLVFTLPGGYRRFKVFVEGIKPATGGQTLGLQVSEDGGATWKTTANYNYALVYASGGTTGALQGASVTSIQPFGGGDLSTTVGAVAAVNSMEITISPISGSFTPFLISSAWHGSAYQAFYGQGEWAGDAGVINAIRFIMSSGNITSGTASLYGIL
jgi:hypothetical protein